MKKGLEQIQKMKKKETSKQKKEERFSIIDCQSGGAVFRFLSLRAARQGGRVLLKGSHQLFNRPICELLSLLNQLGCSVKQGPDYLLIESNGWQLLGDSLTVSHNRSSQFASSLLLNSWNFNKDIFLTVEGTKNSHSYLQMTVSFLRQMGMHLEENGREYHVFPNQVPQQKIYRPEQDMSSLFALSALTSNGGQVVFQNWPEKSTQPDFVFPFILEKMGFSIQKSLKTLKIQGGQILKPINWNLQNTPDLFPVLSALCAMADGVSSLKGAPHLSYKESNRIQQMADLLTKIDRKVKILKDGLIITGQTIKNPQPCEPIIFHPGEDHRLSFAGGVLKKAGFPLRILNPKSVDKSFPDFWSISGIEP